MQNNSQTDIDGERGANIPDGYTIGVGPDGKEYLVPQFMIPALELGFASKLWKEKLDVENAPGGSAQALNRRQHIIISDAEIAFPPDPHLSEREKLNLHAEVLALQEKLGISYKDATYRLYLSEVEKIKVLDASARAFKSMDDHINNSLKELNAHYDKSNAPNADAAYKEKGN